MNEKELENLERECWKFDLKYEFPILFQGYTSKVDLLRVLIDGGYDYNAIKVNIKESMKYDLSQMKNGEKFYN